MRKTLCCSLLTSVVLAIALWFVLAPEIPAQPAAGTAGEPGPDTSRSQTNQPIEEGGIGGSERGPISSQRGTQLGNQLSGRRRDTPATQSPLVARGKYIVHHVAMCIQCHSPRDGNGNLLKRQLLMGAVMPLNSPYPQQTWAFRAPQLAGLPSWSDEEVLSILTTGARPDGRRPSPPMPPFRFKQEDAEAVVAYLRSLSP